MKFQRSVVAAMMVSLCAMAGVARANAPVPATSPAALTMSRAADISLFWVDSEPSPAYRVFAAIGETLGH